MVFLLSQFNPASFMSILIVRVGLFGVNFFYFFVIKFPNFALIVLNSLSISRLIFIIIIRESFVINASK